MRLPFGFTFYVTLKIVIATVLKYKTFKLFYILRPLLVIKDYSNANIAFIDTFDYWVCSCSYDSNFANISASKQIENVIRVITKQYNAEVNGDKKNLCK